METPIHTTEYKGLQVKIYPDYDCSGMFNDSFSHPEPFHTYGKWGGYSLFEHEGNGEDWLQHVFNEYYKEIIQKYKTLEFSSYLDDYDDPDHTGAPINREKAEQYIQNWIDSELIMLDLYVYEHSGITMKAGSGFSCRWDSGQAGYIYMSKTEARKAYMTQKVNVKKVERYMKDMVEYLSAICEGSVYGYVIEDEDGEQLDSCWGYVETEYPIEETYVYKEAMDTAKYYYNNHIKKHLSKRKTEIVNHAPVSVRQAFSLK